jgi:hypothetical protein
MRALLVWAWVAASLLGPGHAAWAFGRHKSVDVDQVVSPLIAGDATAIVEGCGQQPIVGYTFCRVQEGDAANQSLSLIAPPAQCDDDPNACAFIKVADRSGQIVWGAQFKKGITRVTVPWSTLVGSAQFTALQEGFWQYQLEVHWLDPDHHARISKAQGSIALEVYKKGYVPLDRVSGDPNFVWEWQDGAFEYKMTSGLRAYVGKVP